MNIVAHINAIRIARTILWVMLFQLFSPAILAATSDPDQNGYFDTFCTVQGYKTVWIDLDNNQNSETATVVECPYCLFNLVSTDTVSQEVETLFAFLENRHYGLPSVQISFQTGIFLESLPIRGPPLFS